MKILVSGATGFLGYHFVMEALKRGHEIMCIKRSSSNSRFPIEVDSKIKWVIDDQNLKQIVNEFKPQVLLHAAWEGVRGGNRESAIVQNNNVLMSQKYFQLFSYKQIIALGSQAEYGYYTEIVSEDSELNPNTEYGKAKNKCRRILQEHSFRNNIEWQWIRIFTVFGEKQQAGLIYAFSNACYTEQEAFDTTPGDQKYSFLYVHDFACALCNIVGRKGQSGIYNLSQPNEIHSNKEVISKIKDILHSKIKLRFGAIPYPNNQIMLMQGDTTKFEKSFGEINRTSFDFALKSTIINMDFLVTFAKKIRIEALKMVTTAKASHIAGALSVADILAVLYGKYLNFDPSNCDKSDRDRLIFSKGHCCTSLYSTLALSGFYPVEELQEYGKEGSYFISHISAKIPGVEFSSGSLGHGLPYSCGLALAAKRKREVHRIVCIVGDGELQEGSNWEALMFAAHHKLSNLCVIIDYNKMQAMGHTKDIMDLEPLSYKIQAFGSNVYNINGNDIVQIDGALHGFWEYQGNKPTVIIANTVKGCGVSFMEDNLKWHYSNPTEEQLEIAVKEIESR